MSQNFCYHQLKPERTYKEQDPTGWCLPRAAVSYGGRFCILFKRDLNIV